MHREDYNTASYIITYKPQRGLGLRPQIYSEALKLSQNKPYQDWPHLAPQPMPSPNTSSKNQFHIWNKNSVLQITEDTHITPPVQNLWFRNPNKQITPNTITPNSPNNNRKPQRPNKQYLSGQPVASNMVRPPQNTISNQGIENLKSILQTKTFVIGNKRKTYQVNPIR